MLMIIMFSLPVKQLLLCSCIKSGLHRLISVNSGRLILGGGPRAYMMETVPNGADLNEEFESP